MDMEQHQQGVVDILEIYHARRVRDEVIRQLRRLRAETQKLPIYDSAKRREIRGYYEALLLTVAELLHHMGDDELTR